MAFRLTPKDSSFYDMFTASAENLVEATNVLSEFVHEHTRREELGRSLRDLEHKGDQATHAIFRQVNSSFVTPFDREDIYHLASDLDDVMDFIEAAADLVVLTELGTLPAEMGQQVALLQRCAAGHRRGDAAAALDEGPRRLLDRGQPAGERGGQALPPAAVPAVQRRVRRAEVLKLKEVADELEEAADAFEHVANVVETIAVKES